MPSVLIGADICPIEGNLAHFISGDVESLFHDLLPEIAAADLTIANLECPLIEKPSPIRKTGPTFGEAGSCINGIKQAGIDVLSLANNHVLDHGAAGLKNTLAVCAAAGIDTVGAGENLQAARRILVKTVGRLRVGLLAVAEHEFSIATEHSWGANPLDMMDFVRNVNRRRADLDYLIVLLHGSDEFFVPTPRIQDTCRFMIEMGANAVIVQHPHCLGGYEHYQGGHIVYGQGALIMDEALYRNLKSFHEGYLVKLLIAEDGQSRMEFVPFIQSDPVPGAHRMTPEARRELLQMLAARSEALKDRAMIQGQWLEFCAERKHGYLSSLLGHNKILYKINRHGLLERFLHGKGAMRGVRNVVCCETHREAVETIFNNGLK